MVEEKFMLSLPLKCLSPYLQNRPGSGASDSCASLCSAAVKNTHPSPLGEEMVYFSLQVRILRGEKPRQAGTQGRSRSKTVEGHCPLPCSSAVRIPPRGDKPTVLWPSHTNPQLDMPTGQSKGGVVCSSVEVCSSQAC